MECICHWCRPRYKTRLNFSKNLLVSGKWCHHFWTSADQNFRIFLSSSMFKEFLFLLFSFTEQKIFCYISCTEGLGPIFQYLDSIRYIFGHNMLFISGWIIITDNWIRVTKWKFLFGWLNSTGSGKAKSLKIICIWNFDPWNIYCRHWPLTN